jgi:hypothetical protein
MCGSVGGTLLLCYVCYSQSKFLMNIGLSGINGIKTAVNAGLSLFSKPPAAEAAEMTQDETLKLVPLSKLKLN